MKCCSISTGLGYLMPQLRAKAKDWQGAHSEVSQGQYRLYFVTLRHRFEFGEGRLLAQLRGVELPPETDVLNSAILDNLRFRFTALPLQLAEALATRAGGDMAANQLHLSVQVFASPGHVS